MVFAAFTVIADAPECGRIPPRANHADGDSAVSATLLAICLGLFSAVTLAAANMSVKMGERHPRRPGGALGQRRPDGRARRLLRAAARRLDLGRAAARGAGPLCLPALPDPGASARRPVAGLPGDARRRAAADRRRRLPAPARDPAAAGLAGLVVATAAVFVFAAPPQRHPAAPSSRRGRARLGARHGGRSRALQRRRRPRRPRRAGALHLHRLAVPARLRSASPSPPCCSAARARRGRSRSKWRYGVAAGCSRSSPTARPSTPSA